MDVPRMGLELNDWLTLGERVELARWAEDHGFDDAYVAEITDPDAFVTCALSVAATSRIRLGTCIIQIGPRTAPMLASGAAAVDAAGPGRFVAGHRRLVRGDHQRVARPLLRAPADPGAGDRRGDPHHPGR